VFIVEGSLMGGDDAAAAIHELANLRALPGGKGGDVRED
jgi:hypothetical protein